MAKAATAIANEIPEVRTGTGKRMPVEDWTAFGEIVRRLDPIICVAEVLKNGWEAFLPACGERPIIDLFPNAEGALVVRDNGVGIPPDALEKRIGAFGVTDKPVGAEEGKNLGWGATTMLPFLNPGRGALFTTWTEGSKQAVQCLLGLDHQKFPTLLEYGERSQSIHRVPKPVNTRSGSQVVLGDYKFDPLALEFELSERFPRFQTKPHIPEALVRIHQSDPTVAGYSGTPVILKGIAQKAADRRDTTVGSILEIPSTGSFSTPHAHVQWFILGHTTKDLVACYEIWNSEVVYANTGQSGLTRVSTYGIWAAHDRIVLLVTRRHAEGEDPLVCNLFRTDTENWRRRQAQREVSAVLLNPKHPLWVFQKWVSEQTEESGKDDGVLRILTAWETPLSKLKGGEETQEPKSGTSDEKSKDTKDGTKEGEKHDDEEEKEEKEKKPRRRRTRTEEGNGHKETITRPRAVICHKTSMGSDQVRYIPGRNAILINVDVGLVKKLLDEAGPLRKKQGTLDRIKAHMVYSVVNFNHLTGRYPGQEGDDHSLLMAINAPSAALEYVRGSSPKPAKKGDSKRPKKRRAK